MTREEEFREIKSALRGDIDDMTKRDPWTIAALVLNIIVTVCSVAWLQGKNDQRVTTVERDIAELRSGEGKDAEQDVKIAVISTQLASISSNLGEIKATLEKR